MISDVFAADPIELADQRRRHAVREALRLIMAGDGYWATAVLDMSVRRCSRLDTRPLDPAEVAARYELAVRAMTKP